MTKKDFVSSIEESTTKRSSSLTVGLDPVLDLIPTLFLTEASAAANDDDYIYRVLFGYYRFMLEAAEPYISSIKPNIAFFEQYGLGGLKALQDVLALAKDLKLPSILDVKRGDIGSTAESYAKAYLTGTTIRGQAFTAFDADSITVNPFLGFDTLEVFLKACKESGKGMFVLVKTSNPGSKDLQDCVCDGTSISIRLAEWISENARTLQSSSGLSGLGAVVGATHPDDLLKLRGIMKNSLFLIPGLGAQGCTSDDVMAGFTASHQGALVNVSRGLATWSNKEGSLEELREELVKRCKNFVDDLSRSMKKQFG